MCWSCRLKTSRLHVSVSLTWNNTLFSCCNTYRTKASLFIPTSCLWLGRLHVVFDSFKSNSLFNLCSHFLPLMSSKHLPAITGRLRAAVKRWRIMKLCWYLRIWKREILIENNRFQQNINTTGNKWTVSDSLFSCEGNSLITVLSEIQETHRFTGPVLTTGRSYNLSEEWLIGFQTQSGIIL